ncbi:MAG: SDR family NAD(P)-dependent oxidoreductase [Thermoplasmata archaeon]
MGDPSERPRRVAVVTGASSGIGAAVAQNLVRDGWRVLFVGRSPERLAKAERASGSMASPSQTRTLVADLSLLQSVEHVADEILESEPRIDVLVNNAGAVFARRAETSEGIERTLALNVLSPFLLTRRLLDRLRSSNPSRVVNLSSAAHRGARLRFEDLERKEHYSAWGAYGQSKLAILMLTYEFARRYPDRLVTFNAVHPGFVDSRFGRNNPGLFGGALAFAELIAGISPARGARTPTYVATSPTLKDVSGAYFARGRAIRSSRHSYDLPSAERLWNYCYDRTSAHSPTRHDTESRRSIPSVTELGST